MKKSKQNEEDICGPDSRPCRTSGGSSGKDLDSPGKATENRGKETSHSRSLDASKKDRLDSARTSGRPSQVRGSSETREGSPKRSGKNTEANRSLSGKINDRNKDRGSTDRTSGSDSQQKGRDSTKRNDSKSEKDKTGDKSSQSKTPEMAGHCVPMVLCQEFQSAATSSKASQYACKLSDGSPGVVCPHPVGGPGRHPGGQKPPHGGEDPQKPSQPKDKPDDVTNCVPLVQCPAVVAQPHLLLQNQCLLPDYSPGIICSFRAIQDQNTKTKRFSHGRFKRAIDPASPLAAKRPLDPRNTGSKDFFRVSQSAAADFENALQTGQAAAFAQAAQPAFASAQAPSPDPDSPTALTFLNSIPTNGDPPVGVIAQQSIATINQVQNLPNGGLELVESLGSSGASDAVEADIAAAVSLPHTTVLLVPGCVPEPPIRCNISAYRSVTGVCNNHQNPFLGRNRSGFKRLFSNTYDDGISAIRTKAFRGGTLPSARKVSERVLDTLTNELQDYTLSVMQFGQFVDHDLTHALLTRRIGPGGPIECCLDDGQTFPQVPLHPACIPIQIPIDDPFYSQFQQRCMSVVRSLNAPDPHCICRPANPLNEITAFLDSSNVYGNEEETFNSLRTFKHGLMITSAGQLLPRVSRGCRRRASACFQAGDTRVNEQSGLTIMHTVFVREHNRIARDLFKRHFYLDDETLFQEARRILNAEWQHILYNEWLPIIIGFDYARAHELLPLKSGFSNLYNTFIDPSISNSFATAAFRFGHSMVRDLYHLINADGKVFRTLNVTETYFDPTVITESLVGHARTLVARPSETVDTNFAVGVHEQLFVTNSMFGLDLLAFNIQRGRDHGTPTYAQVARACRGHNVTFWGDLYPVMSPGAIDTLRSVYDDVRDIDLFIGGIAELRAEGAQVGPTFQCLIAQQFFDLRFGDRFFYDNGGYVHSFTASQLTEIRKSSWARIMCDTLGPDFGNDFTRVQPLAFLTTLGVNQQIDCNSLAIPTMDLSVF